MKELTQKQLKNLLFYDPETGVFMWRVSAGTAKPGKTAGGVSPQGYARIKIRRKYYFSHRLAFLYMIGVFPHKRVDHVNHVKTDNRWGNLRLVNAQENARNQRRARDNTSGVTGVCWHPQAKRWQANIGVDGRLVHLGLYADLAEATRARKAAEAKYDFHPNHGKTL